MPSFMLPGRTACRCMVLLLAALASVPGFVCEAVVVRPEGAALRVLGSLPLP